MILARQGLNLQRRVFFNTSQIGNENKSLDCEELKTNYSVVKSDI